MNTIDVYPGDSRCLFKRKTFLNRFYFLFLKLRLIIVNEGNLYFLNLLLPSVNESSWGRPVVFDVFLMNLNITIHLLLLSGR